MTQLRRVAALIGLFALIAALSGCSAPTSGAETSTSGAESAPPATAPTIELVAPVEGAEVPAGDVEMSVKTTGLKFVMASNTNVAGEGHVHFTLDGEPFKMSVEPDYIYENVAPGEHTLEAELVQNNTEPFSPPVKKEITFVAK